MHIYNRDIYALKRQNTYSTESISTKQNTRFIFLKIVVNFFFRFFEYKQSNNLFYINAFTKCIFKNAIIDSKEYKYIMISNRFDFPYQ